MLFQHNAIEPAETTQPGANNNKPEDETASSNQQTHTRNDFTLGSSSYVNSYAAKLERMRNFTMAVFVESMDQSQSSIDGGVNDDGAANESELLALASSQSFSNDGATRKNSIKKVDNFVFIIGCLENSKKLLYF